MVNMWYQRARKSHKLKDELTEKLQKVKEELPETPNNK